MRPKLSLSLSLIAVSVAAAVMVGCGGDDSTTADNGNAGAESGPGSASGGGAAGEGTGSSPESVRTAKLTKAQYVKRAEAICLRSEQEQTEAVAAYRRDHPETLEEGAAGVEGSLQEVYLPMKEEELEELRALGAPAGDEDEVEAFLIAFERFVSAAKDVEGAPPASVNRLAVRAGRLAVDYGLRACS